MIETLINILLIIYIMFISERVFSFHKAFKMRQKFTFSIKAMHLYLLTSYCACIVLCIILLHINFANIF